MFRIADGREYFYQWDLNQKIIVDDPTITELHFCNRTDFSTLVVPVKDGLADVPNILLQEGFDFRVLGFDGNITKGDRIFKVKRRHKPADYAYVETEVKSYEYLEKKLNEIEEQGWSDEIVEKSVMEYMYANPLSIYDDGNGNVFIETIPNGQEVKF